MRASAGGPACPGTTQSPPGAEEPLAEPCPNYRAKTNRPEPLLGSQFERENPNKGHTAYDTNAGTAPWGLAKARPRQECPAQLPLRTCQSTCDGGEEESGKRCYKQSMSQARFWRKRKCSNQCEKSGEVQEVAGMKEVQGATRGLLALTPRVGASCSFTKTSRPSTLTPPSRSWRERVVQNPHLELACWIPRSGRPI